MAELVGEIGSLSNVSALHEKMSDPSLANYIVCWMRLVASAELQKQPDFYINFLPNVVSVQDFCRQVRDSLFAVMAKRMQKEMYDHKIKCQALIELYSVAK